MNVPTRNRTEEITGNLKFHPKLKREHLGKQDAGKQGQLLMKIHADSLKLRKTTPPHPNIEVSPTSSLNAPRPDIINSTLTKKS